MTEEHRLDPDAILKSIRTEETRHQGGMLRIFFGMAAGVGKTYAMLRAAQERQREGVDVVIGTVDTHGRTETEALLVGLSIIPRKKLTYRDVVLQEMDLDAILSRKPKLVLVDELAHTNAPGARHPKRWHDVLELLDAGIDVYTTLNVQHVESRKEYVEQVTGITIRETVPDTLLQRATQIILVDITPAELLQRLKDGKVYLGERADAAARNFFQEDRLTALREIALRLTAETVDNELQGLTAARETTGSWKTSERLMVAVSHSPYSEGLVRATRRLAFNLEAPWIAVNVDTGKLLNEQDQTTLTRNLSLVKELGGEVVTTADPDIVAALQRVADQRRVTQMVVGRPTRRWLKDLLFGGTLLDRLVRKSGNFDVHVLRPDKLLSAGKWKTRFRGPWSALYEYWWVLDVVAVVALLGNFLYPVIGYHSVGFLFLLAILALSLFFSLGPILFGAILSALIWDFFFIPPHGTFAISKQEDIIMCVAYLVAALITGSLTNRIRWRENMLRIREERTNTLYEIVRAIVGARDKGELVRAVTERMGSSLSGDYTVFLRGSEGGLERDPVVGTRWMIGDKEWAVSKWAFDNRKDAGWSTDTLPDTGALFSPLVGPTETVGVLAYRPKTNSPLTQDERNLLSSVCKQLAIAVEREILQEKTKEIQQVAESERLYQTILNSVSHELRTPLTAIIGNASALSNSQIASDPTSRRQLSDEIVKNGERLNRVVSNLLDMSRLSSGKLSLKKDWHEIGDLISVVLDSQKTTLSAHNAVMRIAENLPLVRIDFQLFQQALSNLLLNVAAYTAPGTTVEIEARTTGHSLQLTVSDNGPGLPEASIPHLFEMFYRVPGSPSGGAGIGLAITKGIVEVHGGTIAVSNCPSGGARFTINLPIEQQPQMPQDRDSL